MASKTTPVYWSYSAVTLAANGGSGRTFYGVTFPPGTTDWTIVNTSASASIEYVARASQETDPVSPTLTPGASAQWSGTQLFFRNRTNTEVVALVIWRRPGRASDSQPGSGSLTVTGDISTD